MKVALGVDLGSTTTKAVLLDEGGDVLGRGITNSRSNYHLAAELARGEAHIGARFTLLARALRVAEDEAAASFHKRLLLRFRRHQYLSQLDRLQEVCFAEAQADRLKAVSKPVMHRLELVFADMQQKARRQLLAPGGSDFFRDLASSEYSRLAEKYGDREVPFDTLMSVFDKAILTVENTQFDVTFRGNIEAAFADCVDKDKEGTVRAYRKLISDTADIELDVTSSIGTGYGRQRLPFSKENIRSEILCHGLGAHVMFPATATVLDIGGQDTKAIQVDAEGIVTSFQMNDRCAAGCGRYLGYIADEMNMGVHELGPMAMKSTRHVKITSTCTVFAGAELRDRLMMGQRREDILAGLHRAIILRAMALLARSGGVDDEFTFTGGVANNEAAVKALRSLIEENYGARKINISPDSIYTGALGAALFGLRAAHDQPMQQKVAS